MRKTTRGIEIDTIKQYNAGQRWDWAFSVRGQVFGFDRKEDYDYWWGRALDIAQRQTELMREVDLESDMDVQEALEDSDSEGFWERVFTRRNEDPNERLVDDVDPKHRE